MEDKAKDKLEEDDKTKVLDAVKDAQEWLDENGDAEADDLKDKLKDLEDVVSPIFAKLYKAGGGGEGGAGGAPEDHDEL